MANPNKPMGFAPVKYLNGADWDGRGNMYYIDSTDTNAYNVGDPVVLVAGLDTKYGFQTVTRATAGSNPITGIVVAVGANPQGGPYIDPTNLTLVSIPATKTKSYYILVADDPNLIFEIQEGGTGYVVGNVTPSTKVNNNATFRYIAPATGAAYSGCVLDAVTNPPATTATFNLKIMGCVQRPDNVPFTLNQKFLVKINNHTYGASTGTVGF